MECVRLIGRLFFYNLEMQSFSNKGLKVGLGIRGLLGAIVLGAICLYQPLFDSKEHYSGLWLIDAADAETAKKLAFEASKACNRKVELRPLH